MYHNSFKALGLVFILILLIMQVSFAQKDAIVPDLPGIATGEGWKIVNRTATVLSEDNMNFIRLDEKPGDGAVWLEDFVFTDGTIEFDVRGKDVFQRSFLGIAFHGVDEKTYDAIYFRPFNFKNPARASHSIQYISQPINTWQKLRAEFPNVYENRINPVPDPDNWFRVTIIVNHPEVKVLVNNATTPSLTVKQLSEQKSGKIGLWVGNGSGGDFANLKILLKK